MDDQVFAPSERVAVKEVDDELVLLDLEDGTFFVSRGIGPRVWSLLEGGSPISAIAREVSARYGIDESIALKDVNDFVDSLVERGFLHSFRV